MESQTSNDNPSERILQAAETLFSQAGFDGVSMSAVARRAGVSKANVFHHFGSKEELYLAVLRNARHRFSAELGALSGGADHDLATALQRVAERYLHDLFEHADLARLFMRELLDRHPVDGKILAERIFEPNFTQLRSLLEAGLEQKRLREDIDPAVPVMLLVAGCIFFFQSRDVFRHLPAVNFADAPEAYARMLVDILLNGMKPR